MKPLSVGEYGILQNLDCDFFLNGSPVFIIDGFKERSVKFLNKSHGRCGCYQVFSDIADSEGKRKFLATIDQVRRITDPDKKQETEKESSLTP